MTENRNTLEEIRTQLSAIGWMRLIVLGALGFIILFTYEVARPTVESLFQKVHGSQNEPWAWLGVALTVTLVVGAYSRAAGKRSLHELLPRVLIISAAFLISFLLLHRLNSDVAAYCLYLWKDIYIVVLVELFWSIANSVFPVQSAKWLYGIFSCVGGIGAFAGGRFAKFLSQTQFGLEESLWVVAAILIALVAISPWIPRTAEKRQKNSSETGFLSGFKVVRSSAYLGSLVWIIALTQLAITAIDFDFKMAIQAAYPDEIVRQGALSDVYSLINVLALILGLWAGGVIQTLGLRNTLLGIPVVLGTCTLAFIISPAYGVMMVTKIASKSMDYSIFRTAKELLYLPLSLEEKTEGKAVVDILTYRVSKGIASVVLLVLAALGASPRAASIFSLVLIVIWFALTFSTYRKYKEASRQQTDSPA